MIRKLIADESSSVYKLIYSSGYYELLTHTIYSQPGVVNFIEKSICGDDRLWYGFFEGDRIIGVINFYPYQSDFLYLNHVFVDKQYSGKGIGNELLTQFLEYANYNGLVPC